MPSHSRPTPGAPGHQGGKNAALNADKKTVNSAAPTERFLDGHVEGVWRSTIRHELNVASSLSSSMSINNGNNQSTMWRGPG